ncbi:MAG: hypothetical protein A2785_03815 [Candidatus Chisholmbacteria bacterium RIFCSPHIGHO2_01_FULL_49_18]|uniref:Uncharacterized protein n=2 Tax=Candidatus Chisholmiibacteriota TaxID=1817900 RepID=A0A1G1VNA0_9BACT|nr:MAG: hypothetical protein A2785_03815 [Candidatus Chisholmbacteria bacterium RIFCSPHIGHO2_01_FULL_49_18]OGY19442.1 MAG: hypothetical protein A3A65_06045 [Candidatus Chisholmbacteria bacterium RIFCSPLOWO2_01_FULL_49_14]
MFYLINIFPHIERALHLSSAAFCVPWRDPLTKTSYCVGSPDEFGSGSGGKLSSLGTILTSLMDYVFVIAGILLLFMIIASGYTLMTSAGNPEAISKGKSHLTAALVGFLLVFAAFWILQIIEVFLGVQGTPFGFT